MTSDRTIVVIGNFDGVHTGHEALLSRASELAAQLTDGDPLTVVALTFWPHPMSVFAPDKQPKLLNSLPQRIDLLRESGADEVRVVRFTKEFASWEPEKFVELTVMPLNPAAVVVGTNFTFGRHAAGTGETLKELADGRFVVELLEITQIDESQTCSTLVRQAVIAGDVELAAQHLGRPFRVRGVVAVGDQRGRTLGFPTANLIVAPEMVTPADGVYAGWVTRLDDPDHALPGAISVGSNPTFDGIERRVESYVLDRTDLALYGAEIAVDFVSRLRGQVKFESVDDLVAQLHQDVVDTRRVLGLD